MIMRNIDACIECEKDVYEDEINLDCEGNCYCPECFLAILGSPPKEEEKMKIINTTPHKESTKKEE